MAMATYVALLRGINVSGHNPIAMKDLKALFEGLPAEEVTTYLQSGNVVFRSAAAGPGEPPDADALAEDVGAQIAAQLGLKVAVLVRPAEEFTQVVAANPFLTADRDWSGLHLTFLAQPPDPARVAALEAAPVAAGPDAFRLGEREVYLYCPGGYGRTKLNNAFFEKKLALAATTRNWRTVTTLADLARR